MVGCSSKAKLKKKPKSKKQCGNKICQIDDTKIINVIDYLSEDVWFEIFNHLPLKLIFQLKLLSKQWYSLISSNTFMTRKLNICTFFYKISPVDQLVAIVFSLNTDSSDYFFSDQDYIRNGFTFNYLPEYMHEQLCYLGSSNGLLLCRYSITGTDGLLCYLICNPLTGELILLSGSSYESDDDHESHVLVCESSSSTWNSNPIGFMVVRIPEIRIPMKKFYIRIFSSGIGRWKNHKVLCSEKITMLNENMKMVISDQNGRLYWIIETNKIVTYDLKNNIGTSGECMIIDLPKKEEEDDHGSLRATQSCLAESEGFIFYIRIESRQANVSVWLLEQELDDCSEHWSWKVVHKIKVNEMLAGYKWNNTKITKMKPLGFSPMDRNILFVQSDEYILQYNILTRRSQLLSLGSHLHGPVSSYELGVLPFLATTKPTTIPVIKA